MDNLQANSPPQSKKWTFLRKFHWATYIVFGAFMVFFTICLAVGIVSNLGWRYDDMDIPMDRPESLSDLGSLQLRDCLSALEMLRQELQNQVHTALTGYADRSTVLSKWKTWSDAWRRRFSNLGMSCRLTEYRYDDHPTLGRLAEIYRLLDYFQRLHERLVRRFVAENSLELQKMHRLFQHAREMIKLLESSPTVQSN